MNALFFESIPKFKQTIEKPVQIIFKNGLAKIISIVK